MSRTLLTTDQASLVRDALVRGCETCGGEKCPYCGGPEADYHTLCFPCPDCNGSGLRPSDVHLVVEGDRKFCSFHFPEAYERYTQEYGIVDAGTADCVCSWSPPSRWTDGERVELEALCERCDGWGNQDACVACSGEGSVPLASATVKLFTVDGKIDDEADEHWLHVDGYDPMLLPSAPRPGIDWVVRLSEITP